ncbi:hypothetical protein B0H19DRAFT_1149506 [Mycena capillaripes]|nr:hypothetical protein B0H19DRAFT_1149506 [Mycena capillaripes]
MADMLHLGWRMLADERVQGPSIEELWAAAPPAARLLIRETAASDPTPIVDHIKAVRAMYLAGSLAKKRQIVKISSHYQLEGNRLDLLNAGDPAQSDTQLLKVCLHYVVLAAKDAAVEILEWTHARQSDARRYPEVNFLFSEVPSEAAEADSKKLKEAALISLLRLSSPIPENPKVTQPISELTVEQIVGSALSRVFYSTDKVHVINESNLYQWPVARCPGYFTAPQLVSVPGYSGGAD